MLPEVIGIVHGMPGFVAKDLDEFLIGRGIAFKLSQFRCGEKKGDTDRNAFVDASPFVPEIKIGPQRDSISLQFFLQPVEGGGKTPTYIELKIAYLRG